MNVFHYMNVEQNAFTRLLADYAGYKTITTFYGDLSVAEFVEGEKGVKQTYEEVVKSWGKNIKYFTEFVMALNYKCWEWYDIATGRRDALINVGDEMSLSELYKDLYYKGVDYVDEHFKGEDLTYFYKITD